MPVKKKKEKGANWEREAAKILTEVIPSSRWKRVAGSGAIGTILDEPHLRGDIYGEVPALGRTFRAEAKVGYGGSKQITFKRDWLEKIREEAEGTYSIPFVVCKFSGAHGDSKYFVALDFEAFADILNQVKKIADSEKNLLELLDGQEG